jgi:hypothetical protein
VIALTALARPWLLLLATLSSLAGCWGTPLLAVRGAQTPNGPEFLFAYCKGKRPAPPLLSIAVYPVDGDGRALDPALCTLALRPGSGTAPVASWTYGTELPTLAVKTCAPLVPGRRYQIAIGGGGTGGALFSPTPDGKVVMEGDSCR